MHILSSIIDFVAKYRTTLITLTATIIALTVAETAHIVKLKAIAIWQNVVVTGAKKLWAILAAHPYLAVAAAVTTLVAVIVDLSRKTDSAAKAQEALNDIQREAQKEIVEEQLKLENLRKAAMNETNSLKDRYAAIAELNRIVPNYNASIDKTTGKYKENKRALDDYIKSLVHLYEVQGAKKKIQQLAEEKAELTIKEKQARENYENVKKAGPGYNYTTSWGATGNTTQDSTDKFRRKLQDLIDKIKETDSLITAITDVYGKDIQKSEVKKRKRMIKQMVVAVALSESQRKSTRLAKKRRRKLLLKLASVRLKLNASRSRQQTASKLRPTN